MHQVDHHPQAQCRVKSLVVATHSIAMWLMTDVVPPLGQGPVFCYHGYQLLFFSCFCPLKPRSPALQYPLFENRFSSTSPCQYIRMQFPKTILLEIEFCSCQWQWLILRVQFVLRMNCFHLPMNFVFWEWIVSVCQWTLVLRMGL